MTMSEGDLAVAELAFVRATRIAPQPPPAAMTGAIGWLRAESAVDAVQHRADDPDRAAARLDRSRSCVKFLFIDAVWTGADRDACLRIRAASRDRRLLAVRLGAAALFHLRLLSDPGALAGRCVLRDAGGRRRLAAVARRAAARSRRGLFLRRAADRRRSSCCTAGARSACRRSTPCCGAACW